MKTEKEKMMIIINFYSFPNKSKLGQIFIILSTTLTITRYHFLEACGDF